jgi:hypothetical protein
MMVAAGIPQERIANVLEIDQETLAKHYRRELDTASSDANSQVAGSLFRRAIDENHPQGTAAAIFWLKTRGRWREADVDEALRTVMARNVELEAIIAQLEQRAGIGLWASSTARSVNKPN